MPGVSSQRGPTVLEARDLRRDFPSPTSEGTFTVLGPLDLAVAEGEFLAVVGPSGCGKSTLLHLMAGLDRPTAGDVLHAGRPVVGPGPHLGVVFQHYTCLPWMRVIDNVGLAFKWRGMSRLKCRQEAARYVELVGLQGFEEAFPVTLSGGMQQRVAIARSLAAEPQILFMDEPFGALDAQTRATLQVELLRIFAATRRSTVFVTHDIDEAVFLADRVAVLTARPGRIHSMLDVNLRRPRELEVRTDEPFAELRAAVARALKHATLAAMGASRVQAHPSGTSR